MIVVTMKASMTAFLAYDDGYYRDCNPLRNTSICWSFVFMIQDEFSNHHVSSISTNSAFDYFDWQWFKFKVRIFNETFLTFINFTFLPILIWHFWTFYPDQFDISEPTMIWQNLINLTNLIKSDKTILISHFHPLYFNIFAQI